MSRDDHAHLVGDLQTAAADEAFLSQELRHPGLEPTLELGIQQGQMWQARGEQRLPAPRQCNCRRGSASKESLQKPNHVGHCLLKASRKQRRN